MTLIIAIGLQLIAIAMGFLFYGKMGEGLSGTLTGIYTWGFWALACLFACYPGRLTARDEYGDKVKVGYMLNFSQWQSGIFLTWAIGVGGLFIYISELKDIDNSHYLYCWILSWFNTAC